MRTTSAKNNFDDIIGPRSEELAKEAFNRMDVHLHLNMTMTRLLDGLRQVEYLKEFEDIYKCLEKRLEPVLVNQEKWKRDKTYLWHEGPIVVPSDRILALLKWTHEFSTTASGRNTTGAQSNTSATHTSARAKSSPHPTSQKSFPLSFKPTMPRWSD